MRKSIATVTKESGIASIDVSTCPNCQSSYFGDTDDHKGIECGDCGYHMTYVETKDISSFLNSTNK